MQHHQYVVKIGASIRGFTQKHLVNFRNEPEVAGKTRFAVCESELNIIFKKRDQSVGLMAQRLGVLIDLGEVRVRTPNLHFFKALLFLPQVLHRHPQPFLNAVT